MVTGRPAVKAPELDLKHLERMYGFRNRQDVMRFVREHPFLLPLLLEARPAIERHFGGDATVIIRLFADSEDAAAGPMLYAGIVTAMSASEAAERLDQLDEDWWLDHSDRAQGLLCLTVEFL